MDLRVTVILLFIFLTRGYSLQCYKCTPGPIGSCEAYVVTCPDGDSKCESMTVDLKGGSVRMTRTTKQCVSQCESGTKELAGQKISTKCCDTDLCNAADGVYKGSFILLFSPLLFYFLFQ